MNRLKELRQMNDMTQKEIADLVGVSSSAVSSWERGKHRMYGKTAVVLAEQLRVTPSYLLGQTDSIDGIITNHQFSDSSIDKIKNLENEYHDQEESVEYVAIRICGNSMEPKMHNGDIAIIRRQETIESGEIAAVLVNDDEIEIRKVNILKDGIMLVAFNQDAYEPHYYSRKEVEELPIRIYGKLVELRCKF